MIGLSKYFTNRFESVSVVSNSLWLLRKIKVVLSSRLDPNQICSNESFMKERVLY